jgi:hypothetical protein
MRDNIRIVAAQLLIGVGLFVVFGNIQSDGV